MLKHITKYVLVFCVLSLLCLHALFSTSSIRRPNSAHWLCTTKLSLNFTCHTVAILTVRRLQITNAKQRKPYRIQHIIQLVAKAWAQSRLGLLCLPPPSLLRLPPPSLLRLPPPSLLRLARTFQVRRSRWRLPPLAWYHWYPW